MIGYVYIWYDTIKKLYYLGSHVGTPEDNYICSSKILKNVHNKRSHTLKFRVIEKIYTNKFELLQREQLWLDLIDDEQLYRWDNIQSGTVRYYNQKKFACGGNGSANKGVKQKVIKWSKGYTKLEIDLRKQKLLSFIPYDKPKNISKRVYTTNTAIKSKTPRTAKVYEDKNCSFCSIIFSIITRSKQKFCSRSCAAKYLHTLIRNGEIDFEYPFKKGQIAHNKGQLNPQAAINGKASAAKQSQTVTGRRKTFREDGTWYWKKP